MDVKVLVAERNFNDLEEIEEIIPTSDVMLAKGMKTSAAELTFEDATEGVHPLTNLVNTNTSFEDLQDIVFDSAGPQNGDMIIFDGSSGTWINVDPSTVIGGGAQELDDLTDVDTTTDIPVAGDFLQFDGSSGLWIPVAPGGADEKVGVTSNDTTPDYLKNKLTAGTGVSLTEVNDGGDEDLQIAADQLTLEDLTDIQFDSVGPADGEILVFNDSLGIWAPEEVGTGGTGVTQTWMLNGGVDSVQTGATLDLATGSEKATGGCVALVDGEVIGISITISATRTGGSVTGFCVLNGVSQNGAGETVIIDATNTTQDHNLFATPIVYSAGDRISIRTTSSGDYNTDGQTDAAICVFHRNTE